MAKKHPSDCDPEMAQQVDEMIQKLEKEKSVTQKDLITRTANQNGTGEVDLDEEDWEELEDGDEDMS